MLDLLRFDINFNLRSKNPDDSSITGQSEKHKDDVEKAECVVKEWIRSFECTPVRMNII